MTFPLNIAIGPIEVNTHILFELLAYVIGFKFFLYLRKHTVDTISTENRTLILIAGALGAFVFSRIVGYMDSSEFINGHFSVIGFYGNKTILGGLLGGLLAIEICKKRIGVHTSSGDLMTYPLMLAMIIGRIGCFLAGLEDGTVGSATSLPWGINFGDGVYRHPTNIYEILFLLLIWILILLLESRYTLSNGSRFKIFLFSYCVFRLLIEFVKPVHNLVAGLSSIQLASLLGILYYYKLIIHPRSLIEKKAHA